MRVSLAPIATLSPTSVSFPKLPGIWLLKNFISPTQHATAHAAAVSLSTLVHTMALALPDEVVSPAHNINSEEKFKSVVLQQPGRDVYGSVTPESSVRIQCEHFSSYGDGHRLTYFRMALPRVGLPGDLLHRLSEFPPIAQEVSQSRPSSGDDRPHRWRLTLNHYPCSAEGDRPGFPWHRDLKANGAATMILALGGTAQLQFGRLTSQPTLDGMLYADHGATAESEVEVVQDVTVEPADMLVLTGEGRRELLHRVLPAAVGTETPDRASAVWGVW